MVYESASSTRQGRAAISMGDITTADNVVTLAPGVSLLDASTPPDRSGSELSWSLGTIAGFGRASVTITVGLAGAGTLQLDQGARAFAMLDAAPVSDAAPASRCGALRRSW